MFNDAERPSRVQVERDRALRAYVRRQVYPYSVFNRGRLSAAGLGPHGVRGAVDLRRVEPVAWTDVGDGADLVLRPQRTTITRLGSPGLAFRVLFATVLGRREALNREIIDPVYRPILWLIQNGVPIGFSANDLERLSEIGRRWLENAGVRGSDVVASIVPAGPHLDYLQLSAATRRAGVSAAFLEPAPALEDLTRLRPTVVAGRPEDLLALVQLAKQKRSPALSSVHTVLSTGEPLDDSARVSIERLIDGEVAVLAAWAPAGVRAMWAQCRGGEGYHTWPAAEILDVVDPATLEPVPAGTEGELIWSALGWAGTVILRLRTGVHAIIDEATCTACKRTTPRVIPVASVAPYVPILNVHPGVSSWQSEISRRNGSEEFVVFLTPSRPGHPGRLVRDLDARLQSVQPTTQFVVLSADDLERRLVENGYNRVIDRR